MGFENLKGNYGYIIILIGPFLEGETVLILAGFLVHRGHLELPLVIAATFAGSVAGDQFFPLVGQCKGMSFIDKLLSPFVDALTILFIAIFRLEVSPKRGGGQ
jgi:membrane protein DedA with SNARE-associated domain